MRAEGGLPLASKSAWVIRDWDEISSSSYDVGYAPESGSEIRILASATKQPGKVRCSPMLRFPRTADARQRIGIGSARH